MSTFKQRFQDTLKSKQNAAMALGAQQNQGQLANTALQGKNSLAERGLINQGAMDVTGLQGRNSLADIGAQGSNQLANTALSGNYGLTDTTLRSQGTIRNTLAGNGILADDAFDKPNYLGSSVTGASPSMAVGLGGTRGRYGFTGGGLTGGSNQLGMIRGQNGAVSIAGRGYTNLNAPTVQDEEMKRYAFERQKMLDGRADQDNENRRRFAQNRDPQASSAAQLELLRRGGQLNSISAGGRNYTSPSGENYTIQGGKDQTVYSTSTGRPINDIGYAGGGLVDKAFDFVLKNLVSDKKEKPKPPPPPPPKTNSDGIKERNLALAELKGYQKGGVIPGKVNTKVADDITINAKKGEYIIPQEVVGFIGVDKLNQMVLNAKKQLGLPAVVGPKLASEPDSLGRMDKKGLKGIAGGADGVDLGNMDLMLAAERLGLINHGGLNVQPPVAPPDIQIAHQRGQVVAPEILLTSSHTPGQVIQQPSSYAYENDDTGMTPYAVSPRLEGTGVYNTDTPDPYLLNQAKPIATVPSHAQPSSVAVAGPVSEKPPTAPASQKIGGNVGRVDFGRGKGMEVVDLDNRGHITRSESERAKGEQLLKEREAYSDKVNKESEAYWDKESLREQRRVANASVDPRTDGTKQELAARAINNDLMSKRIDTINTTLNPKTTSDNTHAWEMFKMQQSMQNRAEDIATAKGNRAEDRADKQKSEASNRVGKYVTAGYSPEGANYLARKDVMTQQGKTPSELTIEHTANWKPENDGYEKGKYKIMITDENKPYYAKWQQAWNQHISANQGKPDYLQRQQELLSVLERIGGVDSSHLTPRSRAKQEESSL